MNYSFCFKQLFAVAFILVTLCSNTSNAFAADNSSKPKINFRDSTNAILQNDTLDPEARYNKVCLLLHHNAKPEIAEDVLLNVLYPFVKKNWDSKSDQISRLARIYLTIGFCYRERGGNDGLEQERIYSEKALETVLKSEDYTCTAGLYMSCGFMELRRGNTKKSHEYLYKAIEYYDKQELYVKSSEMLYVIASAFFNIKDTDGMKRVLTQMEKYLDKNPSKQSLYQYNVIKKWYFDYLLEKQKNKGETVDYRLVDSVMVCVNEMVYLVENHLDELDRNWLHGYAYAYLAIAIDTYFPEKNDSIFIYVDKGFEMMNRETHNRSNESNAGKELQIHLNQLRANALFRAGKIAESYKTMTGVLTLLDELKDFNNLEIARKWAYEFMIKYYEKVNNPAGALKYQKLLQENEAKRYEQEKVMAINDMVAKYETEKKEIEIHNLKQEKEILWLIVALSLALLTTSLFVIISGRLKRKNVEQRLYETALLAELRQDELDKMQSIKQSLQQSPIKNAIEKIMQLLSTSSIEKNTQTIYLERLSKIDSLSLENACQASKIKITSMDIKYIICFYANIDVKDISLLFNIEPASVHTVRYRIRKKFSKEDTFRTIL